jgi:hypothetical protein
MPLLHQLNQQQCRQQTGWEASLGSAVGIAMPYQRTERPSNVSHHKVNIEHEANFNHSSKHIKTGKEAFGRNDTILIRQEIEQLQGQPKNIHSMIRVGSHESDDVAYQAIHRSSPSMNDP